MPVTTAVGLNAITNQALFSVSRSGTLVFFTAAAGQSELVWVNRAGVPIEAASQRGAFTTVALSPDATQVVYDLVDPRTATIDLWRLVFSRAVPSHLTFNPGPDVFPLWSPDGSRIAFACVREGPPQLCAVMADGCRRNRSSEDEPAAGSFRVVCHWKTADLHSRRSQDDRRGYMGADARRRAPGGDREHRCRRAVRHAVAGRPLAGVRIQ